MKLFKIEWEVTKIEVNEASDLKTALNFMIMVSNEGLINCLSCQKSVLKNIVPNCFLNSRIGYKVNIPKSKLSSPYPPQIYWA